MCEIAEPITREEHMTVQDGTSPQPGMDPQGVPRGPGPLAQRKKKFNLDPLAQRFFFFNDYIYIYIYIS